jgi:hypothetical protein
MLKLVIHVACDECGKRFFFARESDYTTDALRFNTTVLTAMLRDYDWEQLDSGKDRQHFCQECCFNFAEA